MDDVEPINQAVSGRDYVAVQSTVDMRDGVSRVAVNIAILAVSQQNHFFRYLET